eukprot:TRINITY_DN27804_c0_g1_i1.p1 TRINITY_DN27804_c0_g1~~TRINITY_DN27804_c0_g1_i1.p1  ORF type:complete len:221 (+),score=59.22 TRINITY_DN27804_c0_g1_i1:64-663(+)
MSKAQILKPAPAFEGDALVGGDFEHIKLSDYKGKYVVLFFYPLDFTFVCPTEILAFNDAAKTFSEHNAVIIGASTDSKFTHLAWVNTPRKAGGLGGALNIPLLSDLKQTISRDYGAFLEEDGHATRATYIINKEGVLVHMSLNSPPVGRSVEEVLRLLQAFQGFDANGEVCPAGWRPGGLTMKADPKASLEYFEKVNKQ